MGDRELLRTYVDHRDQEAFAALAGRYMDLVYSSALRQVQDPHLADDVTQGVFVLLSEKAGDLLSANSPEGVLGAWLLKTTRYVAMNAIKYQSRRRQYERRAAEMNQRKAEAAGGNVASEAESIWAQVSPLLDGALAKLRELDRSAVVMRFMEGKSHEEVGQTLGLSEEAARKRTMRAVEQLRGYFAAKGVTVTSTALVAGLGAWAVQKAPEALAGTVRAAVQGGVMPEAVTVAVAKGAGVKMAGAVVAGLTVVMLAAGWWLGWGRGAASAVAVGPVVASPGAAPVAVTPAKGRYMDFQVVDAVSGQGIADAALTVWMAETQLEKLRTMPAKTDARGMYRIQLPEKNPVYLRVESRKGDLVPMCVAWTGWELQGGLPPSYTLKMEKGTAIGGSVRDEQGNPIAGASVKLLVPSSEEGSDHPGALIRNEEVKTDAAGKWRFGMMPSALTEVWVKLSHPEFQSDSMYDASGQPSVEELRKMTSVMTMKRGLSIAGSVVDDASGKGIAGVTIRQGDDRWGTSYPETRSGTHGEFRFANVAKGKMTLTAQVAGYMPELVQVEVRSGMEEVRFRLKTGEGFTGQVVDSAGKPVQGANVYADTWRGKRTIEWQGTTDAEGLFVWEDAPADAVEYHIMKEGFVSNRSAKGVSGDEPTTFVMLRPTKIRGKVVDAETGKPIAKFRVVTGRRLGGSPDMHWDDRNSRTLTDGWYEAVMTEPREEYVLRIEADGYLSAVTQSFKPEMGEVVRDVKLQRGAGARGTVMGINGHPAEGVRLFVIEQGQQALIVDGKATDWMTQRVKNGSRSKADGRFAMQPAKTEAILVAFDDQGIAVVPLGRDVSSDLTVKLNAWATIEGTLREGSEILAKTTAWASTPQKGDARVEIRTKTLTDDRGRFTLKHVPPIKVEAGKLNGEAGQFQYDVPLASVEPKPGEVVHQDLGGVGVRVVGRLEIPAEVKGNCSITAMPHTPKVEFPEDWDRMNQDQRNAWTKGNVQSVSFGDIHNAQARPDGTFELVDMPDGPFQCTISGNDSSKRLVAISDALEFTLKKSEGETFDVGLVKLKRMLQVDIGRPCLELNAKALDGNAVRLSDMRGKWVLVTTWYTVFRGKTLPEDVVNAAVANAAGKLEAVTIFHDDRRVWVDRYLAGHPMKGKLIHAAYGEANWSDTINAYQRAQGVLIDPEGVVRAVGFLAQGKDAFGEISAGMSKQP